MSDTSNTSLSRSTTSSKAFRGPRFNVAKTKFERDIEAAINRGVSTCRNATHWHTIVVPGAPDGQKWTDVETKSHRTILQMMAPGAPKCMCERLACQWAWTANWNHKGMFTTQWVLEGQEQKGIPIGKDKEPNRNGAKRVWPMYHSVDETKMKVLIARFPEWHFISANSASHDHPLAHYSTKIASERLMDRLPKGTKEAPKLYVDLNGNPASNAAYMKRNPGIEIVTLVECITPKDFINRATKWGPKVDPVTGAHLWHDDIHIRDVPRDLKHMGHNISGFISIHTTYYYDAQEISALLDWAPNAVYYASMHKFGDMVGTLNHGEQKWEKHQSSFGMQVCQRNVKTGEAYTHPDNAWWFEHDSRICGDTAFGWTMGELCDETFMFVATRVPVPQARLAIKCHENKMPALPESTGTAQSKWEMLVQREVVVQLYGATVRAPMQPEHVDLFDKMRTTLIGKARGPKEYKDHISRCKVAKSGIMSDKGVDITAQQLADLARLSFMIDFQDNYSNDNDMFSSAYATQVRADHLYKEGNGLVTMGTVAALSEMLMAAVEAKNMKMAGLRALKTGVQVMQKRGILNVVK